MRRQGVRLASGARRSLAVALGASAMLAAAPAAQAADTFVNGATGNNASACTSAAQPCATVQAAITKAGSNSTITVAPGVYTGIIDMGDGNSLRASGSAAATSLELVNVNSAAGTIEGFTILGNDLQSTNHAVSLSDNVTVANNVFDVDDDVTSALRIEFDSESPTVRDNRFIDDGVGANTAIIVNPVGSEAPVVSGNEISGFASAIRITRGAAVIRGNLISGTHNTPGTGVAIAASLGGSTPGDDNTTPTIVGNVLRDPVPFNDINGPHGIRVQQGTNGIPTLSATLRRNTVRGFGTGISAVNTDSFTLDGDLISGGGYGLTSIDTAPGLGNVAATNITSWGNIFDINLQDTALTLNSSIVEDDIRTSDAGGTSTCAITFSRGPTTSGANPCFEFQTTVPPQFVDAAAGNFHLLSSSLLIDAGDPAAAHAEPVDFDGDARATAKACGGTALPDVGADEYVPDCQAPQTTIDSGPDEGSTSTSTSAEFTFSSSESGSSFECSLDAGPYSACTTPLALSALGVGAHALAVRATDSAGNVDATPATRAWTTSQPPLEIPPDEIPPKPDTTAPQTTILKAKVKGAKVKFTFEANEAARFECKLDRRAFATCSSPRRYKGLSSGRHKFAVRAVDSAGNADQSPAVDKFRIED